MGHFVRCSLLIIVTTNHEIFKTIMVLHYQCLQSVKPQIFLHGFIFTVNLQMALQMGVSYLPLAEVCISALRAWITLIPLGTLIQNLPRVLPLLLPYLRSQGIVLDFIQLTFILLEIALNFIDFSSGSWHMPHSVHVSCSLKFFLLLCFIDIYSIFSGLYICIV